MREVRKKSVAPSYITAGVCALYALIFPLYRLSDFLFFAAAALVAFNAASRLFPGKTELVEEPEEPVMTGDEKIDALLREGETAVAEMRRLQAAIADAGVKAKIAALIEITDKIFRDVLDDPAEDRQIKRFADFYLPTTMKLLIAYDRFGKSGAAGENISQTLARIDSALDAILESYRRQFDALFKNQALDIETDITVLEAMLKKEGLTGADFK
jgi:5-bromo-4-chloroindolyl phosphate hydrolysis protein